MGSGAIIVLWAMTTLFLFCCVVVAHEVWVLVKLFILERRVKRLHEDSLALLKRTLEREAEQRQGPGA